VALPTHWTFPVARCLF